MSLPFYQNDHWKLSSTLVNQLQQLDWKQLPVTSLINRPTLAKMILQGWSKKEYTLRGFFQSYGLFLQNTANLFNLKLPTDIENNVIDHFHKRLPGVPIPIFRIQAIFNGHCVPIHRDKTMRASMVFPLSNHQGSWTRFYSSSCANRHLIDPATCMLTHQVEITQPTLLNVDICHDVWSSTMYTKHTPRLSLTAKWPNTSYQQLINLL